MRKGIEDLSPISDYIYSIIQKNTFISYSNDIPVKTTLDNSDVAKTITGHWYFHNKIPGPVVTYSLNRNGFRTKEFKKINENKITNIYSGCSHSFGEGMFEDLIWSSQIDNKMKQIYNDFDSYNLSIPASTIDIILNNIYTFIDIYGKPNNIFLMLPPIGRKVGYIEEKDYTFSMNIFPRILDKKEYHKRLKDYLKFFVYEENLIMYVNMIHGFEKYCKDLNINLYWSTWHEYDNNIYKNINFYNYVDVSSFTLKYTENINNYPYWEFAEDNQHFGAHWHLNIGQIFSDML